MATKSKRASKKKVGVGVAFAATAAAAATGAYLLYGSKNAAKNRRAVKGWVNTAKKEVVGQIKKAKKTLSKADYEKLVDRTMKKYHKLGSTSASEVNRLTRDLKREWSKIVKMPTKKKVSKRKITSRKKTVKKVVRKRRTRSEERRVGKECRSRWSPYH